MRSNERGGLGEDLPADDIEDHVDRADVGERLRIEVHERLDAETACEVTVGSAAGSDDDRSDFTRELYCERTDASGRAVDQHGLTGLQPRVIDETLPSGEAGDRERSGDCVVDICR